MPVRYSFSHVSKLLISISFAICVGVCPNACQFGIHLVMSKLLISINFAFGIESNHYFYQLFKCTQTYAFLYFGVWFWRILWRTVCNWTFDNYYLNCKYGSAVMVKFGIYQFSHSREVSYDTESKHFKRTRTVVYMSITSRIKPWLGPCSVPCINCA